MVDAVVRVSGLVKGVPGNPGLLNQIDIEVAGGSTTAIVGRSGSGKSTLLSLLALLDAPDAGRYEFLGRDVGRMGVRDREALRGDRISFVFQRFALLSHLSALENVIMPLRHRGGVRGATMRRRGLAALESVEVGLHASKRPRMLSGGEQQRVAIARALISRPSLILADEPTGALDATTGEAVMDLLIAQARDRGAALVIVTHDMDLAARCDQVLHLRSGSLHTDATA